MTDKWFHLPDLVVISPVFFLFLLQYPVAALQRLLPLRPFGSQAATVVHTLVSGLQLAKLAKMC